MWKPMIEAPDDQYILGMLGDGRKVENMYKDLEGWHCDGEPVMPIAWMPMAPNKHIFYLPNETLTLRLYEDYAHAESICKGYKAPHGEYGYKRANVLDWVEKTIVVCLEHNRLEHTCHGCGVRWIPLESKFPSGPCSRHWKCPACGITASPCCGAEIIESEYDIDSEMHLYCGFETCSKCGKNCHCGGCR